VERRPDEVRVEEEESLASTAAELDDDVDEEVDGV